MGHDLKRDYIKQARFYEQAAAFELEKKHGDTRRAVGFLNRAMDKYQHVGYKVQVGKLKKQIETLSKRRSSVIRNIVSNIYDFNRILMPGQESRGRSEYEPEVASSEQAPITFRINPQYLKPASLAEVVGCFVALALGVFFISPVVTGNVIGSMSNLTSNITGIVFILVGLLLGFFFIKKK